MFITFEGADGSGKSTQIKFAKQYLADAGYDVITTRDPGGTKFGLQLRKILLNYPDKLSSLAEMFIFFADRAQHVDFKIKPMLEQGKVVLCDRYIDSTVAYQGYGRGISIEAIEKMNAIATQNIVPDLTLLFDITVETSMERMAREGTKDRLESEVREFHQNMIDGYRTIAQKHPERFVVIDANKSIDVVNQQIKAALDKLIQAEKLLYPQ